MADEPGNTGDQNTGDQDKGTGDPSPNPLSTAFPGASEESLTWIADRKWEGVEDLAQGYRNLERAFSNRDRMVEVPSELSDDATKEAFRKALGIPDAPGGYEPKIPEGMDIEFNEERLGRYLDTFHKHNVPPGAVQAAIDLAIDETMAANKAHDANIAKQNEEWEGEVRRRFGEAYDTNIRLAQRAVREVGSDEFAQMLDDSGLGNHPDLVEAFARWGKKLGEEPMIDGDKPGAMGITPDAARRKIDQILGDPKHPHNDHEHPDHRAAVDEMRELFETVEAGRKSA